MKKLSGYFLQGLIYLAPISITIYAVYVIFDFTDGLLNKYIYHVIDQRIPGLGVLLIVIVLTGLGYVGQTILARPFKYIINKVIYQVPLLELIYTSVKDFFTAFVGKEKRFNKPVIVTISQADKIERIGFMTNEHIELLGSDGMVAVYFPFSYTFTGEVLLVPKASIRPINLPATEVMKFVVAGGVAELEQHH